MDVGVAVVIRPALLAVLRQAGAVAVDGVEGGHGVDHAVVRPPALVDVEAAGGVLVIVFAHVDRAGVEQRPHPGRRDVVAGDRVLHGLVAGVGEVVDVRLDADAVVDLERSVDRQVEKSVVVVRHEVGAEHALQRLEHGLVRILVDAELLELEVIEILDLRDAEALGERLGQICCRVHDRAVGLDEGRAVVGRGDLGHGVHPAALAAGEQRTRRSAGGLGRGNFLGAAVGHQLEELARGRAAEAVTDEVDGVLCAPAGEERLVIGDAVARVVVRRSVRRAVIDRRAGQLGIELARAVPCAGDRADGGRVRLIAERVEVACQAAGGHAPVGQHGVDAGALPPAHQAVHEHDRVVLAARAGLVCGRRRKDAQARGQNERQQQAQKTFAVFHHVFPPKYISFHAFLSSQTPPNDVKRTKVGELRLCML